MISNKDIMSCELELKLLNSYTPEQQQIYEEMLRIDREISEEEYHREMRKAMSEV